MNTRSTHPGPFVTDRVAEWRQRMIEDATPRLAVIDRVWPWVFVLALVAVAGFMQHWS